MDSPPNFTCGGAVLVACVCNCAARFGSLAGRCTSCGCGGCELFCAIAAGAAGSGCGVRGPLGPGLPGGGVASTFFNSLGSSSGCRDMATRSLSEMMLLLVRCVSFCKSGGSVRNVTSLPRVTSEGETTTTERNGRY